MSKFNDRVLFEMPSLQSLEDFKDLVLTKVTSCEQSILRIATVINAEVNSQPSFGDLVLVVTLVGCIGSILAYLGRRKHAFYRHPPKLQAQVEANIKALKAEIDSLRKHILNYMAVSQEMKDPESQSTSQEERVECEGSLDSLQKILRVYDQCVKTNNSFNEYFLDQFKLVFLELKELKKSRPGLVRGSSKKKDLVEKKVNLLRENSTPVVLFSSQKVTEPIQKVTDQTPKPLREQETKTTINVSSTFDKQSLQEFRSPFEDQVNDQPSAEFLAASLTSQPILQETTEAANFRQVTQQLPEDPIINMPTPAKHTLPALPIKPKTRQVPPMTGRRPPPPPRRGV